MTPPGPSDRPLEVLWLIKGLDMGGAERLLLSLAQVHDRTKVSLSCAYILPSREHLVSEMERAGVKVECLTRRSDTGLHWRDLDLRWALALRRRLLARPVDVLHLHIRYTASIGRLVARSIPAEIRPVVVFTEHNVWGADVLLPRIANRLTIGLDDADIAVSATVRNSMSPRVRRRVKEVIHGLDISEVVAARSCRDDARRELGAGPDDVLVGTIANYRSQKAYDVLLEAAALLLRSDGGHVRFVSVGHGPLASEIQATHRRLGLDDRFKLLGARDDALRLLSAFDIFVLASRFEGFPVSIMEALAMGVPVVATAVGGVPAAIEDGRQGFIVPVERPDLLADAVLRLADDPELLRRMSEEARAAGESYDITRAAREIEAIYQELTFDRRPSLGQGRPR